MRLPSTDPTARVGPTGRAPARDADERRGGGAESGEAEGSDDDRTDAQTPRATVLARGESVRRAELRRAYARLESQGGLTAEQRRVVAAMATAVVDGILAAPASAIAAEATDGEATRTIVELFEPE